MQLITLTTGSKPILIHVPHAGYNLPNTITPNRFNDPTAVDYVYRSTRDMYADRIGQTLADTCNGTLMINHISRLYCDVNRYPDDREPKNTIGMGAIYTHDLNGQPLYKPNYQPDGREHGERFNLIYYPWHRILHDQTQLLLNLYDQCTILDIHTYSQHSQSYELKEPRPHIILTVNENQPSQRLAILLYLQLLTTGHIIGFNTHYHTSIMPHMITHPKLVSIRITIRQDTASDQTLMHTVSQLITSTLQEANL